MSRDNVTPFRRPPPKPVAPQRGEGFGFNTHRGKAALVQLLALAAFALNLVWRAPPLSFVALAVGVAAALLAFSNRGQAMPWANTHHEHAIRTLIIGYSIWVLAGLLTYISPFLSLATFFIQIAVAIWAGVRTLVGLVLALMRRPINNPYGWLI